MSESHVFPASWELGSGRRRPLKPFYDLDAHLTPFFSLQPTTEQKTEEVAAATPAEGEAPAAPQEAKEAGEAAPAEGGEAAPAAEEASS